MAEPYNTPMPTAPGTPISATPRSASPAAAHHSQHHLQHYQHHHHLPPIPDFHVVPSSSSTSFSSAHSSRNPSVDHGSSFSAFGTGTGAGGGSGVISGPKPIVLHLGDPIRFNPDTYAQFSQVFHIIRPGPEDREREPFQQALREKRWGDFFGIFRPFWSTGGEMGNWDAELIALLPPSVRVFASAGAGFDWVDTRTLGQRGVVYCNGSLAAAESVADFAVAMIISTFRMLPLCMASATVVVAAGGPGAGGSSSSGSGGGDGGGGGDFQSCHVNAPAQSHTLRGHTLGIIGLGNIGQAIAYRCSVAFGMHIAYHDIESKSGQIEATCGGVGGGAGTPARFVASLEELVAQSDCVVLAIPSLTSSSAEDGTSSSTSTGNNKSGAVIDAALLRHFRAGSRFVNVARGSLVDEDALADALDSGKLSNVALDVHANEPHVSPRLKAYACSRAMLTCHNAGGTVEAHAGFEELAMRNILDVWQGSGKGISPVNLHFLNAAVGGGGGQKVMGEMK